MKLRSERTIDPVKTAVRVATVGDIDIESMPATIDGVTLATGDRVLVKEQTDPNENGIYDHGDGRSRDSNQVGDGALGQVLFVADGSVNRGQAFVVADLSPPTFEPVVHWRTLFTSTADQSPDQADGQLHALYTHTLAAGQLCRDGDRIEAMWAGTYGSSASSRQLRVPSVPGTGGGAVSVRGGGRPPGSG